MDYPASLELDAPANIANWRPLVHWLLDIPHLLIANVLGNVGGVIALISWFAILFTGRLPEGLELPVPRHPLSGEGLQLRPLAA